MSIEITRTVEDHLPELGRICFEAFGSLHDRHAVPRDFDDLDTSRMVVGFIAASPHVAGFTALLNGRPVGSNFISFADRVAGVGPITVDPACQSRGVGRALMQAVLDEARRRDVTHVRLMQEAVNTTSLSLYTSLGFDWRDAMAIMRLTPGDSAPDPAIRPLTEADLPDVERLAVRHYHHSRRNEAAGAIRAGLPTFARTRDSRLTGYLIPGYLGHAFAETHDDMLALLAEVPRSAPPPFHKMLVPMSEPDLYRALLRRGCRTVKVMNYMSVGPYTPPQASWLPSIGN